MWSFSSPIYYICKFKHQLEFGKLCCLKNHTFQKSSNIQVLPEPERPAASQQSAWETVGADLH